MATPRKKKGEAEPPPEAGEGTASPQTTTFPGEAPADINGSAAEQPPPANGVAEAPAPGGPRRKPDQSFKIYSDKTTQLEVAIWENEVRYDDKVSVQHNIVLSRSYKNGERKWVQNTVYRTHDLPLVRFLMDKAHAWCADRRTQDSSCPF